MQPVDAPPIQVTDVQAATGYASGAYIYAPLGSAPVVPNTPFKIHFDRLLQPDTASRQSICLQSRPKPVVTSADCGAGVLLDPAYDPVRREVTYRQSPMNTPLVPGGTYQLTTYVPTQASSGGFRSFEGTPLGKSFSAEFVVSSGTGTLPPYDTITTADHFCKSPAPGCSQTCAPTCNARFAPTDPAEQDCEIACLAACPRSVNDILGQNGCAFSMCHGPTPDGSGVEPQGLVMASVAELRATAIGQVAHETQEGENARVPNESPPRFGRAMPILDPGVPGNSYLVYKLLANRCTPLASPFPPAPDAGPLVDGGDPCPAEAPEVHRVRASLVVGLPMPPSGNGAYLRVGEAEWLADWLLQGAPTPACK